MYPVCNSYQELSFTQQGPRTLGEWLAPLALHEVKVSEVRVVHNVHPSAGLLTEPPFGKLVVGLASKHGPRLSHRHDTL